MSRVPFYLPPGVNPMHVQDEDGPRGRRVITFAMMDEYGRWTEREIDGGPNLGTRGIYLPLLGEVDSAELTNLILAYREKEQERVKKGLRRKKKTSEYWLNLLREKRERQEAEAVKRSTYGYHGALVRN